MKMTLLEIVQDILNDLDSDAVNSIDDTVESQQVAQIVKSTYFALLSNRNWEFTKELISLIPSIDLSKPTHMKLQDNCNELVFVNYDNADAPEDGIKYREAKWLSPDAFIRKTNQRRSTEDNILVIDDYTGVKLLIRNDKQPEYYTSFNDEYIVFDSYNSDVDSTMQESKVQAFGYTHKEWRALDEFIPDMPDNAFTLLLEKAKSRASLKLRQVFDQLAEREVSKQERFLSQNQQRIGDWDLYPVAYGRKRNRGF